MSELLDIYNINRIKTGKIIDRQKAESVREYLKQDEYVLGVQCWIINYKKEILLTQRSPNKKDGGKWEATSGLVQSGENSLQGIKRELKEEIGVIVNDAELKLIKSNREGNTFRDAYCIYKDIPIEEIKFADGEVSSAKYVTIEEFEKMINSGEAFEWSRWFIPKYKELVNVWEK